MGNVSRQLGCQDCSALSRQQDCSSLFLSFLIQLVSVNEPFTLKFIAQARDLTERCVTSARTLISTTNQNQLQLRRPIFERTAYIGPFGCKEPDFIWEQPKRLQISSLPFLPGVAMISCACWSNISNKYKASFTHTN